MEDEYIASRRSGVEDQTTNVMNQTKRCLQEGIAALAMDVYSMAEQMDVLLTLQSSAVDSVASQVDLLKTRYTAAKEQHLNIQLEEMQLPEASSTTKSSNKPSVEDVPVERLKLPKHLM